MSSPVKEVLVIDDSCTAQRNLYQVMEELGFKPVLAPEIRSFDDLGAQIAWIPDPKAPVDLTQLETRSITWNQFAYALVDMTLGEGQPTGHIYLDYLLSAGVPTIAISLDPGINELMITEGGAIFSTTAKRDLERLRQDLRRYFEVGECCRDGAGEEDEGFLDEDD